MPADDRWVTALTPGLLPTLGHLAFEIITTPLVPGEKKARKLTWNACKVHDRNVCAKEIWRVWTPCPDKDYSSLSLSLSILLFFPVSHHILRFESLWVVLLSTIKHTDTFHSCRTGCLLGIWLYKSWLFAFREFTRVYAASDLHTKNSPFAYATAKKHGLTELKLSAERSSAALSPQSNEAVLHRPAGSPVVN